MDAESANPGWLLARIAASQHGVATRSQLEAAGIGRGVISARLKNGHLHRVHRGVYAVGHRGLSREGRWMAAVLACGGGAVLSHLSAAALWGLLDPRPGAVDVAIAGDNGRRRHPGIRLHRLVTLMPDQQTRSRGIPVTTPARTISDLRRTVSEAAQRRAIRQAEVLGLRTGLERSTLPTRSELEDLFLRLCRHHRLPLPQVNVVIGGFEVDFLWSNRRVIVETDGYRYHRGATGFEEDRRRDLALRSLGYDVVRFTYRQVTREAQEVAAEIRRVLEKP